MSTNRPCQALRHGLSRRPRSNYVSSIATASTATYQCLRHASLLRRPLRPYTFTQLITFTDGSTAVQRTTSPLPLYKTTKDTRNHPLWNPSSQKLANVEEDEAGRLRAFRQKFGRGWDAEALESDATMDGQEEGREGEEDEGGLMDLISGFGQEDGRARQGTETAPAKRKSKGGGS
ncbi:MAG: hypothetical protein M1838_001826 [Thelocarpon superellum]|nr:MAG: hypothetical protein M1838_001826 [Thelocarpon superellum]